jgi:hypothetical protein
MASDLTGAWRGHYEQAGLRHGISMRVAQSGQSFVGTMRDDDTLLMSAVKVEWDDDVPPEERHPIGDAEVVTSLPEGSIVEGRVEGQQVEFEKRYQGAQRTTIWVDGRATSHELPSHSVLYRGQLADDATLRGEWSITSPDGGDGERGAFELRRS